MMKKLKQSSGRVVLVRELGNSTIVVIPKEMCKQLGWKAGDSVQLRCDGQTVLVEKVD